MGPGVRTLGHASDTRTQDSLTSFLFDGEGRACQGLGLSGACAEVTVTRIW
jgi:hypothetical protein